MTPATVCHFAQSRHRPFYRYRSHTARPALVVDMRISGTVYATRIQAPQHSLAREIAQWTCTAGADGVEIIIHRPFTLEMPWPPPSM